MFQLLESGEHMGEVQAILRRSGNQEIGQGEDDMVFAITAPHWRPMAIMGADPVDSAFFFLDGIELPDVKGIADCCLSNMRRFGAKMRAQTFNLVGGLPIS